MNTMNDPGAIATMVTNAPANIRNTIVDAFAPHLRATIDNPTAHTLERLHLGELQTVFATANIEKLADATANCGEGPYKMFLRQRTDAEQHTQTNDADNTKRDNNTRAVSHTTPGTNNQEQHNPTAETNPHTTTTPRRHHTDERDHLSSAATVTECQTIIETALANNTLPKATLLDDISNMWPAIWDAEHTSQEHHNTTTILDTIFKAEEPWWETARTLCNTSPTIALLVDAKDKTRPQPHTLQNTPSALVERLACHPGAKHIREQLAETVLDNNRGHTLVRMPHKDLENTIGKIIDNDQDRDRARRRAAALIDDMIKHTPMSDTIAETLIRHSATASQHNPTVCGQLERRWQSARAAPAAVIANWCAIGPNSTVSRHRMLQAATLAFSETCQTNTTAWKIAYSMIPTWTGTLRELGATVAALTDQPETTQEN